jgi:hypothetical protein
MKITKSLKFILALTVMSILNNSVSAIPTEIFLTSTKDITNDNEGLNEPSGLSLSHDKKSLWTVSDDTSSIFKISLKG